MKKVIKTFQWDEHDIHVELTPIGEICALGGLHYYHYLGGTVLQRIYQSMQLKDRDNRILYIYTN